jgi:hypothetical protein
MTTKRMLSGFLVLLVVISVLTVTATAFILFGRRLRTLFRRFARCGCVRRSCLVAALTASPTTLGRRFLHLIRRHFGQLRLLAAYYKYLPLALRVLLLRIELLSKDPKDSVFKNGWPWMVDPVPIQKIALADSFLRRVACCLLTTPLF